ncbi:TPA: hypothetical protein PPU42_002772, partial [Staphylococcus aureus]|nr:hypothetical protein [Staphylococcus aureus]
KQNDPIVANVYIETGWAVNRLLDNNELSPFDDYDRVEEKIMNEINWKKTHIKEC